MMVKSVNEEYYFMERFILFPINEFRFFNDGKKNFNACNYENAIFFFEKAKNLRYLKKECIKYLIDCHIELHHFEEVYKMIENEFVDKNVDEEYLLKKYLHTMFLEEQYVEVNELINLYKDNKTISSDLREYLIDLKQLVHEKKDKAHHNMMKYFLSDDFEDHIQIILNLDKLDVDKYKIEIDQFLNNREIDAFVKFNLLKYLFEHQLVDKMTYTNYYDEEFLITKDDFIDLLNNYAYLEPIKLVLNYLSKEKPSKKAFLKNIWLDFCIKHYPHLINDMKIACAVLHILFYKSLNMTYDIKAICDLYEVSSTEEIFHYFSDVNI